MRPFSVGRKWEREVREEKKVPELDGRLRVSWELSGEVMSYTEG